MSLRLAFLVLTAGLLTSIPAVSAPSPTGAANKAATLNIITELRQAHTLLETAIHDYDGHRGKAQHEVHVAIKDLEEHHRKTNPGVALPKPAAPAAAQQPANPPAEKPQPTPEQQKASDAQLQAAIVILTQAEQALSTSTHPSHLKAAARLKIAITELNTALNIK